MAKKHFNLLLVCLTAFAVQLHAQTPSFKVALDKNCLPVKATFTNTSTGFSAGAVYTFNFGEGGSVPFLSEPLTHTYLLGGSYTATLTVTDGGKITSTTQTVVIYKAPVVSFAPNVGKICANGSITFTSTSTAGDGTISNYLWDFGDGSVSDTTAGIVHHIYTSGSVIKAGLTVTNSFGCMASLTLPNVVSVLAAPQPTFNASATALCHISDGISFTNTTTGGATPTTYLWSFGDGATSNSTNAVHNYSTKGNYTVKLIATSSEGCTDTSAATVITVGGAKASIAAPSLLCANSPVVFTDSSSPQANSITWLLDNKVVTGNGHQYTATFTDTTLHTVQLVNVYGTCSDTATKVVQMKAAPATAPFTYQLNGFCNAATPNVTFKEGNNNAVKWEWDFNNTIDSIFHPADFTQNPTHVFPAAGTYNVKVRVTNATGCTSSLRQPVTVAKNTIALTSTEGIFGCHNLSTTFKATSTQAITQYNWTFSDDNSTSTADTPHHTFPAIGGYSAFIKVKTNAGCTDTARIKVYVGYEPNFKFTVLNPGDTAVCGNKLISFKVTGNSDSLIGSYYWNFGDATTYTLVNYDSIFTHQYLSDGNFTVSMAIKNHGCNDTITKLNYIHVSPPFAKILSPAYDCNNRLKVVFKEGSIKPQTYSWNFNDGSPVYNYTAANIDPAVTHNFPNTGVYNTVLTTTSGTCVSKDSLWVRVLNKQTPVLSATQTLLCANDTLHTLVSGMSASPFGYQPPYAVKAVQYADTTKFTGAFTPYDVTYQNPFHINIRNLKKGKDSIRLITTSAWFGCADTTQFITVQVNGPTAGFTLNNNTPCLSDKVVFADISKGDGTSPIQKWQWLYGDGMADTLPKGNAVSHQYQNPGTYKAKLVVTDASHCSDTAYSPTNNVTVLGPQAKFTIAQNPILPNAVETFVNGTDSGKTIRASNSYTWQFGDGSSATSLKDSITHVYKQYSDDTVTLMATSSTTGCTNIATTVVHVKNTNLKFIYTTKYLNPASTCPPLLISFTNKSNNFKAISWNFGDSLTAGNVNTPTHTYYKPGVYKVTIYGYYSNNTYDSSWEYINIAGPTAIVSANTLSGCGSRDVVFTAKTNNTASLLWDFGDGTSSTDTVAHHVYKTPNVYMPTITVKDSMQCSASYSLSTPIAIDSLHVSLRKDSVLQCHQMLVNFTPTAFSVAGNNKQTLTYTWQFGNGSNASSKDTGVATYTHSGVYPVSLITTSPYGCKDTLTTQVAYNDVHFASIQGATEFCENTPVSFFAAKTNSGDALTYKWLFQKDSSTLQNPLPVRFSVLGNNTITLWTNKNGCTDTVTQKLTIHSQPAVTMSLSNSIVCLGSAVVFDAKPKANNSDTLTYFWNLGDGKDSAAQKTTSLVYAAAGTYPVLLRTTSNFGCQQQLLDTVVVASTPHVFINAPIEICKNGTVTFTSASTTASTPKFLWHFPDGTTSSQQNPDPKTFTAAGVNDIYLIANLGNCYDTAHHQLTVHDNPLVNLTASAQRVCFGDSVQLTAHNGKTYQWTINNVVVNGTNVANPRLSPSTDTKYSVLAIDNFGCKNSDSLSVHVTKRQQLAVATPMVHVCTGNKVSLSVSGTDVYNWINGSDLTATNIANPSTLDSAQSKTYTVVGSDAYGCFTDTAHVQVIVHNAPVIAMSNNINNITTPVGAPTQLSATSASPIVKWNWQPTLFLSCTNCDAPLSKPRQNIHYHVEGTDSYGCKGSDTLSITVVCSGSTIGIPEAFSPNGDGRNDRFGVNGYGIKNIKHFVIFARNGNKVFERNNVSPYDINAQWDGMYNNAYMPTGTYVYIIEATCDAGEAYNVKGTVSLIR